MPWHALETQFLEVSPVNKQKQFFDIRNPVSFTDGIFFAMDFATLYQIFQNSEGVSTDTRADLQNKIFFALKGANFNGNHYAKDALSKGAVAAVVDEDISGNNIYQVPHVLSALQEFAHYHRRQLKDTTFIGLTGSNGKTTTKELLLACLSQDYPTMATQGNLNNHIGVPLTLLSVAPKHKFAIIEMGANHMREIAELSKIAAPDYGLITNIGKAHVEGFGSIENIDLGKRELFENIKASGGQCFINVGDPYLSRSASMYPKAVQYGGSSDYRIVNSQLTREGTTCIALLIDGKPLNVETKLVGTFNAQNVLAAATVAYHMGMDFDGIARGISSYHPSNHRSQLQDGQRNTLLIDAYNANPSSMEQAIEALHQFPRDKKLAILGAMKEGGETTHEEHQKVAQQLQDLGIAHYLIGEEFKKCRVGQTVAHYNTTADLITSNVLHNIQDHLILLKGSRSVGLEKLIPLL